MDLSGRRQRALQERVAIQVRRIDNLEAEVRALRDVQSVISTKVLNMLNELSVEHDGGKKWSRR